MKKLVLIAIPILVVLALVITLVVLNNLQTPAWKASLDRYMLFLMSTDKLAYHVLSTSTASQPGHFTPEMSADSFSDSVIFEANLNPNLDTAAGLQPVPYPPQKVVCVLIGNGGPHQLVYVALHTSLYNADWIVHISADPWGSSTLQTTLDNLGCSL